MHPLPRAQRREIVGVEGHMALRYAGVRLCLIVSSEDIEQRDEFALVDPADVADLNLSSARLRVRHPERIAIADSPEQLIKDCDIIITSLANDEAIKAVYEAFSKALEVCTYNKQPTSICRIIT